MARDVFHECLSDSIRGSIPAPELSSSLLGIYIRIGALDTAIQNRSQNKVNEIWPCLLMSEVDGVPD
jgi:hypothetical protein